MVAASKLVIVVLPVKAAITKISAAVSTAKFNVSAPAPKLVTVSIPVPPTMTSALTVPVMVLAFVAEPVIKAPLVVASIALINTVPVTAEALIVVLVFNARAPVVRLTLPAPVTVMFVIAVSPVKTVAVKWSVAAIVTFSTPAAVILAAVIVLTVEDPSLMLRASVSILPTVVAPVRPKVTLVV